MNSIKKRELVFAFLAGVVLTSSVFVLFMLIHTGKSYQLVDAEEYCRNDICDMQFTPYGALSSPNPEFLRYFKMGDLDCLSSNEDPDSTVLCLSDGDLFFTYDMLRRSVSISYRKAGFLTMMDVDEDGTIDSLMYDGIDANGNLLRTVKDSNMDGILELHSGNPVELENQK